MRNITLLFMLLLLRAIPAGAQHLYLKGRITDKTNRIKLPGAKITLTDSAQRVVNSLTDSNGNFLLEHLSPGAYSLRISHLGFKAYEEKVSIAKTGTDLGRIELVNEATTLDEVKIVQRILEMLQKEDTTEFNAAAFKVNPDANAADLLRKMPTIDLSGKTVKAQGETVYKVLLDGRPFFGDNPYASLLNLPADVIDKVLVYSEKSEQDLFTGFSGGVTTKTINLISKPEKRNNTFGKVYGGFGGDDRYLAGGVINDFKGNRRITVTVESNNVNIRNFSEQDLVSSPATISSGTGATNAIGLNYNNQWKKADLSASYFFNQSNNSVYTNFQRQSVLKAESGQFYNESDTSSNKNYSHRLSLRLNYVFDPSNSILWQPGFSLEQNDGFSSRSGGTSVNEIGLNTTHNKTSSNPLGYNFSNSLLYKHKFSKAGRTFSLDAATGNVVNKGTTLLSSGDVYLNDSLAGDSLKQVIKQVQNTWTITANAVYTEPVGKKGLLQLLYNLNYIPASSARNANDSIPFAPYLQPDTLLSNTFRSSNTNHKLGASYQLAGARYRFSAGVYYQLDRIKNTQILPDAYTLSHDYGNVLPAAHFEYRFSKTRNLDITYSASTSVPTVTQLQPVVNNTDPLFFSAGDSSLRQPYEHNLSARYNVTNYKHSSNFYIGLQAVYGLNYITSNAIIRATDTVIQQGIILHKGVQLTTPVNIDGYKSTKAYVSYSLPLATLRSNLNIDVNTGLSQTPGIINSAPNLATAKSAGLDVSVSSNISENIDFLFSSASTVINNENTLGSNGNNTYFNQSNRLIVNLILWKGIVLNTDLYYQNNSGLIAYNREYLVWNMGIGKKLFKDRSGDIRLVFYDILNQNTNIEHTVTEYYIQDTHNNAVNQYFLLTFTYKIKGA